jgi:N-acetylglucosamine kinase-like BadF-type ATPase
VGEAVAASTLATLFAELADTTPAGGGAWFGTASLDPAAPQQELDRIRAAASAARLSGPVVVSSDIVALLLVGLLGAGRVRQAGAVAVVSGTGSGVRAGRLDAAPVTIGSLEYLASDEGSAFALAQDGLRAAVRAGDGRGPACTLGSRFEQRTGRPLNQLVRELARTPFPKTAVAALADVVTQAWQAGDPVAAGLVEQALQELQAAVLAGVRRAALRPGWCAVLAGGVFSGCPALRAAFSDRLAAAGAAESIPVLDPAGSLFQSLAGASDPVPGSWLGSAVWTLEPAGRPLARRC